MGRLWASVKHGRLDHPAWDEAESQYMAKYEGKSEVDLTENLSDLLNLAILRYPDGNAPNEEWPEFIDYYIGYLMNFLRMDMKLDEKLVQPLEEINALLYDLESGRRNVHIPPSAGTGKDPWEKSMLMGRVSALVTHYLKYGGNKKLESACRRAARFLQTAHIVFRGAEYARRRNNHFLALGACRHAAGREGHETDHGRRRDSLIDFHFRSSSKGQDKCCI